MVQRGLASFKTTLRRAATVAACLIEVLLASPIRAETLMFYASASGKQTLDQGEGGGNPFASAVIEALTKPSLRLTQLPAVIQQLTSTKSRGFQAADVPASVAHGTYHLSPRNKADRRIALVLVVSDYSRSGGAPSLPGAKHDADRIATALRQSGFDTEIASAFDLRSLRDKLAVFAARSRTHDTSVIYTTGHGVEVDGTVFLVPGDYPIAERNTGLTRKALPVLEIAAASQAKQINLVFYGGCRDNPFSD